MAAATATTTLPIVFGTWTSRPSTTPDVDLEAQVVVVAQPIRPTCIRVVDPITYYLEYPDMSRCAYYVSPRDNVQHTSHPHDIPPPYSEDVNLPTHTAVAEPPTLAMYLFKFGFLCPPFWLFGVIILLCPAKSFPNWEPTKTESEREELLGLVRRTEVKWAKRCLVAFAALLSIVFAALSIFPTH